MGAGYVFYYLFHPDFDDKLNAYRVFLPWGGRGRTPYIGCGGRAGRAAPRLTCSGGVSLLVGTCAWIGGAGCVRMCIVVGGGEMCVGRRVRVRVLVGVRRGSGDGGGMGGGCGGGSCWRRRPASPG
jgi:hypothetical protein